MDDFWLHWVEQRQEYDLVDHSKEPHEVICSIKDDERATEILNALQSRSEARALKSDLEDVKATLLRLASRL